VKGEVEGKKAGEEDRKGPTDLGGLGGSQRFERARAEGKGGDNQKKGKDKSCKKRSK